MRNNDSLRLTITRNTIILNTSIIIIVNTKINRDLESDGIINTS